MGLTPRLKPLLLLLPLLLFRPAPLRAEHFLLRSGQRLDVTGYERLGDSYRLQVVGGMIEVAAADVVAIEPEDNFRPVPPPSPEKMPFRDLIEEAARRYGVDADLITSVIAVESDFEPRAVSRRNARGLMQLLPATAQRLGVRDVFDPRENIDAGTRHLKDLLGRYSGDLVLALAAYNAGPESVQLYGNVPPFFETRSYVRRVKRFYENKKSDHTGQTHAAAAQPKRKRARTAGL